MFWGLVLEPGKRYSTTVEKSFHVSKAVLDCSSARTENEILSVMLETEGSESLLCNLCKQKGILQESLDLNFMTGDRLTFECRGHGRVHLSGYLLPDDDDDMSGGLGDEEESEEDEEEAGNSSEWSSPASKPGSEKKKRKNEDTPSEVPSKKKKEKPNEDEEGDSDDDDDDDDEDDDESDLSAGLDEELDEEEDEGTDKDDDEDDGSEDEEEVGNLSLKKKQLQKQDKNKTPNKQNLSTPKKTPLTNGLTPKEQKSNKKTAGEKTPGEKTPGQKAQGEKTPNNATPKQRLVLDHGVTIREVKIGNGMPAKPGKTVSVYYVGKLKESNKVFDKQLKGDGFKFKLGKEEVIKGWDIGIQGMKVGGKRVIHCPPAVAYGAKGVPPKIPPNSTLIFDVELKHVN